MSVAAPPDAWRTRAADALGGSFPPLAVLYVLLFGAFGTEAPFFPLFLKSRGRSAAEIGLILSAGTIVRVSIGPLVGVVADRVGIRRTLACATVATGAIGYTYLAATSLAALLAVSMAHASVLTSLNPLCDALALPAAVREKTFAYGWVRGVGSGSFVVATLAAGALVTAFGLSSIIVVSSALMLLMAAPLPWLTRSTRQTSGPAFDGLVALLALPAFRRVLLAAGLVIGSQAMSDTFAAIHWRASGIGATAVGALWAEAVASELLVFLVIGPALLRRLGPRRCVAISAMSGIVQWGALASTVRPTLLVLSQPLHGLTFALMHLACMEMIGAIVPESRIATAQAIYGTLCLGLASAILTFVSGELWGSLGAPAFWVMSALCLAALPIAATLRTDALVASY